MFSPAHKYGILRQKEVCRLKDNRIHFDLERKLRRYAISDLMKYIVIGQGIVFALLYIWPTLGYQLYSLITLTRTGLMRRANLAAGDVRVCTAVQFADFHPVRAVFLLYDRRRAGKPVGQGQIQPVLFSRHARLDHRRADYRLCG